MTMASNSYTIRDYRSKRPIQVRAHTRNGKKGFLITLQLFVRKATIVTLVAIIVASSYISTYLLGSLNAPIAVHAQVITKTVEVADTTMPPVLKRIELAESGGSQFCDAKAIGRRFCKATAKGTVLMRANTNGSTDIGEFQINNYAYGAEAVSLGYDLNTEEGNESMARYIYAHQGTEPWYSSKANWK